VSDAAWVAFWSNLPAILTAVVAVCTAIGGIVIGLVNRSKNDAHAEVIKQGVADIQKATNGMKDQLVANALATGQAEGKAEEQAHPTTPSVPITGGGRRTSDQ
jgi:hypothetical protein